MKTGSLAREARVTRDEMRVSFKKLIISRQVRKAAVSILASVKATTDAREPATDGRSVKNTPEFRPTACDAPVRCRRRCARFYRGGPPVEPHAAAGLADDRGTRAPAWNEIASSKRKKRDADGRGRAVSA